MSRPRPGFAIVVKATRCHQRPDVEAIMIKNGLYSLHAKSRDGVAEDVGGILILRDGQIHGGDAYVYYTGSYECSAGSWNSSSATMAAIPAAPPIRQPDMRKESFSTVSAVVPSETM